MPYKKSSTSVSFDRTHTKRERRMLGPREDSLADIPPVQRLRRQPKDKRGPGRRTTGKNQGCAAWMAERLTQMTQEGKNPGPADLSKRVIAWGTRWWNN